MKSAAVFLDRDGTIIEDREYIGNPDDVCLLPGATGAIRRFAEMGHLVVIVSNQSGVARGLFDEEDLRKVHTRVEELLAAEGAGVNGVYYCPFLDGPDAKIEKYRRASELRKPKPGMLLQAAREMDIDLKRSWMIGNSLSDVEAGKSAGCRTILLRSGEDAGVEGITHTVGALSEAADVLERTVQDENSDKLEKTDAAEQDDTLRALGKIHDLLERTHRRERQHDFSMLRLFGALLQMFAIIAGLWGMIALLNEQNAEATARLIFACFLQLASITAFTVDRLR
ncbi:MAG: HAD family hydrolase [Phycisphaerales bacterium]|nr:MAG: HAD family hydrolase [Phycisphaerales bacterium]